MTDEATRTLKPGWTDRTVAAGREIIVGQRRESGLIALRRSGDRRSIAYMDPGNFATNIEAGSRYGYLLLWVVVLANVTAMLFQGLSAKLGIVTGKSLAEQCRDHSRARSFTRCGRERNRRHGDRSRRVSRSFHRPEPVVWLAAVLESGDCGVAIYAMLVLQGSGSARSRF